MVSYSGWETLTAKLPMRRYCTGYKQSAPLSVLRSQTAVMLIFSGAILGKLSPSALATGMFLIALTSNLSQPTPSILLGGYRSLTLTLYGYTLVKPVTMTRFFCRK